MRRWPAAFSRLLKQCFGCMLACEARHPSWFGDEATALMTGDGITRVIADPPKGQPGPHVPTTADIYVRLHGSPRMYYSAYEPGYIAQLARDMAVHNSTGARSGASSIIRRRARRCRMRWRCWTPRRASADARGQQARVARAVTRG